MFFFYFSCTTNKPFVYKCYIWQNTENNITLCCSVLLPQPQKNENSDTFSAPWWQAWCFPGGSKSKNIYKKNIKNIREILCRNILWIQTCTLYSIQQHVHAAHLVDNSPTYSDLIKLFGVGQSLLLWIIYILHVNDVFFITYNLEIRKRWSV